MAQFACEEHVYVKTIEQRTTRSSTNADRRDGVCQATKFVWYGLGQGDVQCFEIVQSLEDALHDGYEPLGLLKSDNPAIPGLFPTLGSIFDGSDDLALMINDLAPSSQVSIGYCDSGVEEMESALTGLYQSLYRQANH